MVLPVSPTLQIVLSHNKLGKGGHATLFRFWGEVVWSKAIQMAQILRFFFFHSCQKKNSIFISIHWKPCIVFYLTSFHGAFPAHFLYTLWREWITGSQTLFWPSSWAGLNICSCRKRRFKQQGSHRSDWQCSSKGLQRNTVHRLPNYTWGECVLSQMLGKCLKSINKIQLWSHLPSCAFSHNWCYR